MPSTSILNLSFKLHMSNSHVPLYIYEDTMTETANQITVGTLSWQPPHFPVSHRWSMISICQWNTQHVQSLSTGLIPTHAHSPIYPFNKCQVSISNMPDSVLGEKNTAVNNIGQNFCLHEVSNPIILIRTSCFPSKYFALKTWNCQATHKQKLLRVYVQVCLPVSPDTQ